MIGVIAFVALVLAIGVPATLLIDRRRTGAALLGCGFLLGVALHAAILFLLSLSGVPWQRTGFIGVIAAASVLLWVAAWKSGSIPERAVEQMNKRATAIDLLTIAIVAGHSLFSTLAPLPESDFMTIWGLKAKVFWMARGVDFDFLMSPWSVLFHVDYPILLPLSYDSLSIIRDSWDDRIVGVLTSFFGAAALLIVRRSHHEATGHPVHSALATLAMASLLLSPWIGLAEGPLVAYILSGILIVHEGLRADRMATVRLGALLLGCAGLVKNEGMAVIAAAALALLSAPAGRRNRVIHLWPSLVVVGAWLVPRAVHGLSTDLARAGMLDRFLARLANPSEVLGPIGATWVGRSMLWCGIALALAISLRYVVREERFPLTVVALQFGAYLAAYLVSPHSLDWHVRWSWERLVSHMTPTLTFVALVSLTAAFSETKESRPVPASQES